MPGKQSWVQCLDSVVCEVELLQVGEELQHVGWQAGEQVGGEVQQPEALQPIEGEVVHLGQLVTSQPEDGQPPLRLKGPVLDPDQPVPGEVHQAQLRVKLEGGGAHLLQRVVLQGQALDSWVQCCRNSLKKR